LEAKVVILEQLQNWRRSHSKLPASVWKSTYRILLSAGSTDQCILYL